MAGPIVIVAGGQNIEENDDHGLRGTGLEGEAEITSAVATKIVELLLADGSRHVVLSDANFNNSAVVGREWGLVLLLRCREGNAGSVVSGDEPYRSSIAHQYKGVRRAAGLGDEIWNCYLVPYLAPGVPLVEVELGSIVKADGGFGADLLYLGAHTNEVAEQLVAGILGVDKEFLGMDLGENNETSSTGTHEQPSTS